MAARKARALRGNSPFLPGKMNQSTSTSDVTGHPPSTIGRDLRKRTPAQDQHPDLRPSTSTATSTAEKRRHPRQRVASSRTQRNALPVAFQSREAQQVPKHLLAPTRTKPLAYVHANAPESMFQPWSAQPKPILGNPPSLATLPKRQNRRKSKIGPITPPHPSERKIEPHYSDDTPANFLPQPTRRQHRQPKARDRQCGGKREGGIIHAHKFA